MSKRTSAELMEDWQGTLKEITGNKGAATWPQTLGLIWLGVAICHISYSSWTYFTFFLALSLVFLIYYGVKLTKYTIKRDGLFKHLCKLLDELAALKKTEAETQKQLEESLAEAKKKNKSFHQRLEDQVKKRHDGSGSGSGQIDDEDDDTSEMVTLGHGVAIPHTDYEKLGGVAPYSKEGQAILNDATPPTSEVEKAMRGDDFKLPSERGSTVMASSTPTGSGIGLINEITEERSSSSPSSTSAPTYGDYGDYGDYIDYSDYSDSSGGDDY